MKIHRLTLCLLVAAVAASGPALGKSKKKKKKPEITSSHLWLFDPDHPATPHITVVGAADAKLPHAPLFTLSWSPAGTPLEGVEPDDIKVTEREITVE